MVIATETIGQARPAVSESHEVRTPLDRALNYVALAVLTLVALVMFIPFIFSVSTSLKSNREATQPLSLVRLFVPENVTFSAYSEVFDADIVRWFGNSVFVAA